LKKILRLWASTFYLIILLLSVNAATSHRGTTRLNSDPNGTLGGQPGGPQIRWEDFDHSECRQVCTAGGVTYFCMFCENTIHIEFGCVKEETMCAYLPNTRDAVEPIIESSVVAADQVEIVLKDDTPSMWWKAIRVFACDGRQWEIHTEGKRRTDSTTISAGDLNCTSLEFKKAAVLGFKVPAFWLGELDRRLSGGTRVTFRYIHDFG